MQIYTQGVYLHRGMYCAYERGLSFNRWVKILWTDPDDMLTLWAIFFTVSLATTGVSFKQACNSSNISIGNNKFGLTMMETIFEVNETIMEFIVPAKN